jgi:hypothetical protein
MLLELENVCKGAYLQRVMKAAVTKHGTRGLGFRV